AHRHRRDPPGDEVDPGGDPLGGLRQRMAGAGAGRRPPSAGTAPGQPFPSDRAGRSPAPGSDAVHRAQASTVTASLSTLAGKGKSRLMSPLLEDLTLTRPVA